MNKRRKVEFIKNQKLFMQKKFVKPFKLEMLINRTKNQNRYLNLLLLRVLLQPTSPFPKFSKKLWKKFVIKKKPVKFGHSWRQAQDS